MAELNPEKLLTDFLREVGTEQTELITNQDGLPVLVSKAEAVARTLYLMALGGTQERKNDKGEVEIRSFKPNIAAMKLIREYTEGKPFANKPAEVPNDSHKPGQFDKATGSRLSRVLGTDVSTNNSSTRTPKSVSSYPRLGNRPGNGTKISETA